MQNAKQAFSPQAFAPQRKWCPRESDRFTGHRLRKFANACPEIAKRFRGKRKWCPREPARFTGTKSARHFCVPEIAMQFRGCKLKNTTHFLMFTLFVLFAGSASALSDECKEGQPNSCSIVYPNGNPSPCSDSICKKCQAECELDWVLGYARTIISAIVVGLAILFLAIHGLRLFTSGPEGREDAKRGIVYIVIGIVIALAAYAFVEYMRYSP